MKDYWLVFFQLSDGDWMLSCHDGKSEESAIEYAAKRGDTLSQADARVFRCQCDPRADILTVAQQLVWEKRGDVQRFISQQTLNAV